MKRLLIVGVSEKIGGIETLFKGLFETKSNVFDVSFLCFGEKCAFEDLYISNGYKVFHLPTRRKSLFSFNSIIKDFFIKHNQFDYIWVNTSSTSMYQIQYYGKRYTNAKIITHSHGTTFEASSGKAIHHLNKILGKINYKKVVNNTDLFFCCSLAAGEALFGSYYKDRLILIKNGIDVEKFSFSIYNRELVRKDLSIDHDTIVVGLFGRLSIQKNPIRALCIYNKYFKTNPNSLLMCVGDGELKKEMKKKAKELGVSRNILFLGFRTDVDVLLSAVDVMLMPSLFEGLPLGGIEAQTNGLPVLFSNTITPEVLITDASRMISLQDSDEIWADYLKKSVSIDIDRERCKEYAVKNGYDRESTIAYIESLLS